MQVPANLITTSWNLMHLHKSTDQSANHRAATIPAANQQSQQKPAAGALSSSSMATRAGAQKVYTEHMRLQDKLLQVRINPAVSADGLSVENTYSTEVGETEMGRYRALNTCPDEKVKDTINEYHDKQRLKLIKTTEEKLDLLIQKAERMRQEVLKANRSTGAINLTQSTGQISQTNTMSSGTQNVSLPASEGASLLLQPVDEKDKMTAVRKLRFNSGDQEENNKDDEDDDDYLNCSVNSEDFEIDEIDVETVDNSENAKDKPCTEIMTITNQPLNSETDILKQCIEESGLVSFGQDITADTSSSASLASNDSLLPDSTSSNGDSPISMASAEETTNQNMSSDLSTNFPSNKREYQVSPLHFEDPLKSMQNYPQNLNNLYKSHMFSTPEVGMRMPDTSNIQAALSEISKLCGAPTMTFTPDYRRDMGPPALTPEVIKPSSVNDAYKSVVERPSANIAHYPDANFLYSHHHYQQQHRQQQQQHTDLYQYKQDVHFQRTSSPNNLYQQQQQPKQLSKPVDQSRNRHNRHEHQQLQRPNSADTFNNNVQLNNQQSSNNNSSSSNNNNNSSSSSSSTVTSSTTTTTTDQTSTVKSEMQQFETTPVFRTHRMLTPESTEILLNWYSAHIHYPYPSDAEVEHLTQLTGITGRQVKKWMANRRVRCFNTLSITGNQHPIKYKYQGHGRKRKSPMTEKENCDSTTSDKKPNYAMLTEEAKTILNQWYEEHLNNPYPSETEKSQLAERCGISMSQVKSWFANKRNRTNNTKRQVPNYFIEKFPEYSGLVHLVGQKREEERMLKRRKLNEVMYIQPPFYF